MSDIGPQPLEEDEDGDEDEVKINYKDDHVAGGGVGYEIKIIK